MCADTAAVLCVYACRCQARKGNFFIVICVASATTHIHACVRLPLNCKKSAHCQQHEAFNIALILATYINVSLNGEEMEEKATALTRKLFIARK